MFTKNKRPVIFTNDYKRIKANLAVKMKDGLFIKFSGCSGNRFVGRNATLNTSKLQREK